ncbi:MAG: glycosyltransferase family 2 protein [Kiritimatiellia bacterium]
MQSSTTHPSQENGLSIILPIYNEQESLESVLTELQACLLDLNLPFELLCVDDGSTDKSHAILTQLKKSEIPEIRILKLSANSGQSTAFAAGFTHASFPVLVTMDADGQNDPRDIARLLEGLKASDVCCGYREKRQDRLSKKVAGRIGNGIRNRVLHSEIIDTGCSLKAFKKEALDGIPLYQGMHRFLPDLCKLHHGAVISQIAVHHRSRNAGTSKYTNWGRFLKTVPDLMAVRWMKKRHRSVQVQES